MSARRVVVAGPYPTMPGPEAAATFTVVRELVGAGDDVIVVSPAPSAAHHHADPGGPRGAARLARLVGGAELLHLRLDAASLRADIDSPRLLPGRIALNGVLRRAVETEVRLDRVPSTVSRQWASLVLGKARRVLVADSAALDSLANAGVDAARIVVAPEPGSTAAVESGSDRRRIAESVLPTAAPTAAELQALMRERAAEDRALNRRAAVTREGAASLPLRHLVRMERAPVRSAKPGGAFLKRVIAKLLAWQFDNVVASVNRLHQATIDSIDALEAALQAGEDTSR
ncbi:MAG TPA: hypothetical protein VM143_18770 [Acidimicrobiales bacterium]|nr:hypothetical protein [Acidimicrobiales bacterium]